MITPEAVEALRRRVLTGGLTAAERAALADLIVAVDAAVYVHQAEPGVLWAHVAAQYRELTGPAGGDRS